jgi:biotin carboxyl carrier protein
MIFDATVLGRTLRVEVRGSDGRYSVRLDGEAHEVSISDAAHGFTRVRIGAHAHEVGLEPVGSGYRVSFPGDSLVVELAEATRASAAPVLHDHGPARLTAPMPGRVVRVLSERGADVVAGQGLVVIEAMKMENELRAPRAGRLLELLVREGQAVEAGALLAVVA